MMDLNYLRTYGCESAGCTDPAWAERGLHASNCTQAEIDGVLDLLGDVRALLADWWEDQQCCDSDWCAAGGTDKRLGRALAHLGIIDRDDAR